MSVLLNYFDNFYNVELFLWVYGIYFIYVVDLILFYINVIFKNKI